ncbi:MAG: hypothetical protein LQ351_007734 [Letrouitia transgressa]|nr:MAG: hypothetical protein LQ351_007734 [Letrouitia transgressa]
MVDQIWRRFLAGRGSVALYCDYWAAYSMYLSIQKDFERLITLLMGILLSNLRQRYSQCWVPSLNEPTRPGESLREPVNNAHQSRWKQNGAIYNKKKFQSMVSDVHGFNDNLESLFPAAKRETSRIIKKDVNYSDDLDVSQSLQKATSNQHETISEFASARLEVLQATTSRSRGPRGANPWMKEAIMDVSDEDANADRDIEHLESGTEELQKQMEAIKLLIKKKLTALFAWF